LRPAIVQLRGVVTRSISDSGCEPPRICKLAAPLAVCAARQVIDWPMAISVFGMARTITRLAAVSARICAIVAPETTEINVRRRTLRI
jgi:hypothetical protein